MIALDGEDDTVLIFYHVAGRKGSNPRARCTPQPRLSVVMAGRNDGYGEKECII